MSATMVIETITVAKAKKYLVYNTNNYRPLRPLMVTLYAAEMSRGRWELNGETISFHADGSLLNGQHRLHAVIESGVTIEVFVVRGLTSGSGTIDTGGHRTIGQWCTHHGYKNAAMLAATARNCLIYKTGGWEKSGSLFTVIPNSVVYDFITVNNEVLQPAICLSKRSSKILPSSLLACILHIGCGGNNPENVELATWFAMSLAHGGNLSDTDAVFHLRNKMLAQTPQKRFTRFMVRALLTMAWNKTVAGETCSAKALRLRMTGPKKSEAPGIINVISEDEL